MADPNSFQITFQRFFNLLKLLQMLHAPLRKAKKKADVTGLQHRFLVMVEDSVNSTNTRAIKWLLKGLKGDDAQSMVDFLNELLNDERKLALEKQKDILYFLTLLAKSAQVFPKSLELANVKCDLTSPPARTGGYASIYQGSHKGQAVCVKICYSGDKLEKRARAQAKELIIWAHLEHPNVLPLLGFYFSKERVCIVTPWMKKGCLSVFLRPNSEIHPRGILWIRDIITGLNYLHSRNIIHGDLKAENVLVSETERAMLADFGISRVLAVADITTAKTTIGSRSAYWAAPELFSNQPHTRETDIWALGCTIHEVLTGKKPFYQYETEWALMGALADKTATCKEPSRQLKPPEQEVWELGKQCRTLEYRRRPSSDAVLHSITRMKTGEIDDDRLPVETWGPRKSSKHVNYSRVPTLFRQIDCFVLLIEILARPFTTQRPVELVGNDAQSVVDFLSELLDEDAPLLSHERRSVLLLLCKLAKSAQVFPKSLRVQGVKSDLAKPVSGGGLSHICEGQYKDKQIHIKVVRFNEQSNDLEQKLRAHAVETICWAHLTHDNVLPFHGIYASDANVRGICIVFSSVAECDMLHYLMEFPDSPSKYIPLLHDTISGLQYLHDSGIVYVNLRAENVLVSKTGRAKLAGFEISQIATTMTARSAEVAAGNANWMAPELLVRDNLSPTKESDIWAFGCTCYEAMTGMKPFLYIPNISEAFQKGNTVPSKPDSALKWDGLRKKVWSTVAEPCWTYDPRNRPTSDVILGSIKELLGQDGRDDDPELLKARKVAPSINFGHLYKVLQEVQQAGNAEELRAEEERRAEDDRQAREERRAGRAKEEKQISLVLEQLASKGMPSAMLDSKERMYAPRCNPDTRLSLRNRVINWGRNDGETRHLFWLLGPAGVGKSAVAQTVAEKWKQEGLPVAVFFFSRPNNRADPDAVIPTLAYQLALLLPEYRRIITQQLVDNPLILHKSRHLQFNELLAVPLRMVMTQHQETIQKPLLIVLDGLDECSSYEAQCEFVEMISHYARTRRDCRLRWMICSRPEPHLSVAFSSEECQAICLRERLEVDDSEPQADAIRILHRGFAEIRGRYFAQLSNDWPGKDHIDFIARRASGHLGFVAFIIRFIGDQDYDDPSGQLDACLRFLTGASRSEDPNPLYALDLLYTQILSDVPAFILPTMLRILGILMLCHDGKLTALDIANFLGLDQGSFYRALQRLQSALFVPPPSEAPAKPVRIYHASFSDYLRDPSRSGKYYLDVGVAYFNIVIQCLGWLCYCHKNISGDQALLGLTWISPLSEAQAVFASVCKFSFTTCWKACRKILDDNLGTLTKTLEDFDFNLDYSKWPDETHEFAHFIRWLLSSHKSFKSLVVIDHGHEGEGDSAVQGEISIWHRDDDPYAFVAPFFKDAKRADTYSFHLRLGKFNPAAFWLKISPDIDPRFTVDTL